jgi:CRISPR-associated protein Cmr1
MTKITLKLRTVTPLFMGGAEPEQAAELREPSIKGLLRFWYRVLYPNDPESETRIFGGQGKGQGQSRILLRITDKKLNLGNKGDPHWNGMKTAYLGYGVINREETGEVYTDKSGNEKPVKKDMTTRPYIKSGSHFVLTILFKPLPENTSEEDREIFQADKQRVRMAVWAWLMFGGLGARTRNGFGSLAVESVTGMDEDGLPELKVKDQKELKASIRAFIEKIPTLPATTHYPDYTHWSNKTKCLLSGHARNGEEVLENLGSKIHSFRSYRSPDKLTWVQNDHDLMDKFIRKGKVPTRPPFRSAFGLPHNYFFSSSKQSGEVNFMDENGKKGRRASPLFFTVYEFSTSRQACIVALFLPAELISAPKTVRISTGKEGELSYRYKDLTLPDDFTAVTDVLDELAKKENHGLGVHP